jgi:E-phenylitaconyl-CoA hydratase
MLVRPRFDAAEAHALGLVTEVVPEGGALHRCLELSDRIAELPALAVATIKAVAEVAVETSREGGVLLERLGYAALAQTDEARAAGARWRRS